MVAGSTFWKSSREPESTRRMQVPACRWLMADLKQHFLVNTCLGILARLCYCRMTCCFALRAQMNSWRVLLDTLLWRGKGGNYGNRSCQAFEALSHQTCA
eukprot:5542190-Amphidinium_carterae.1